MSDEWLVARTAELEAQGISRGTQRSWERAGRLRRMARGVVLVGPRLDGIEGVNQDAHVALAAHPGGTVTGVAAAMILGLDGFQVGDLAPERPAAVQLGPTASARRGTVTRARRVGPVHRVGSVDLSAVEDILLALGGSPGPVPRPGCAAASRPLGIHELVELAVEDALRRGYVTLGSLHDAVRAARAQRPGRDVLARILAERGEESPTESYLETRCVQELRRAGLPAFRRQAWVAAPRGRRYRLDLVYSDPVVGEIVIEPMGRTAHADRLDPDTVRQGWLTATGRRVVPVTFATIEFQPERLTSAVERLLRGRRAAS